MSQSTASSRSSSFSSTLTAELSPMWSQIERMPFDELRGTKNFIYIEKVMSLVSTYEFSVSDARMSDSRSTILLGRLLKLISSKCADRFRELSKELEEARTTSKAAEDTFKAKAKIQEREIMRLQREKEGSTWGLSAPQKHRSDPPTEGRATGKGAEGAEEVKQLQEENDSLAQQLRRMTRLNEELRQSAQARLEDKNRMQADDDTLRLEYRHLVSRYKRLQESSTKLEEMLREAQKKEDGRSHDDHAEISRLTEMVKKLQEENYELISSRDRAEELCERRESEALRDMTELRRLTKDIIEEEREKLWELNGEYAKFKEEAEARSEELRLACDEKLQEKENEVLLLRQQLDSFMATRGGLLEMQNPWTTSELSVDMDPTQILAGADGRHDTAYQDLLAEKRRLDRENGDLAMEVEQLEMQVEALTVEQRRIASLLKNYERGDEGLRQLRQELAAASQATEMLQGENAQLRERLIGLQDSLTFSAALQELCKRIGVTEEEINSLRPQHGATFDQVDTLREEIEVLKEEVEWLERERRHWMNKVRLQPLLDTKLRFELGLTSEQLKQLDTIADQMKRGCVIEEEEDANYKEKYFSELQARRRDASQFNEYVKGRVEAALQQAFKDVDVSSMAPALAALQEHIEAITCGGHADTPTIRQLQEQLESTTRRLEEAELTIKDTAANASDLREQLTSTQVENDSLRAERDQYRDSDCDVLDAIIGDDSKPMDEEEGGEGLPRPSKKRAAGFTLRGCLKAKDSLISSLGERMEELRAKLDAKVKEVKTLQEELATSAESQERLREQIETLNELNEAMVESNNELKHVNQDLQSGITQAADGTGSHATFQKIVILRRREAVLMQRLRRSLSALEDARHREEETRVSMETTFRSLREALEGSSTGFVLPMSASVGTSEKGMLGHLHQSLEHLLKGKLYREDSCFLLQLQRVHEGIEKTEELVELRLVSRSQARELEGLQRVVDEQQAELETLKTAALSANDMAPSDGGSSGGAYSAAAAARWESEAVSWRQKYSLCLKRLEEKEGEVTLLESQLDSAREELTDTKDHVQNLLSTSAPPCAAAGGGGEVPPGASSTEPAAPASHEREVARLKSINLGLLQHTMDLQAAVKSLEIELDSKRQEVALIKDAGNAQVVTDFVEAALREHVALRRQGELSVITAKKLKVQLAATEANFRVVANEAASYKLSAYRLYRQYVEQVMAMVDYVRCMQRASRGALSPQRVEIMDRRFRRILRELHEALHRNKDLSGKLSDQTIAFQQLEQQVSLLEMTDDMERAGIVEGELREAHTKTREHARRIAEFEEDLKHAEGKASRAEAYIGQLTEEIARLEFNYAGAAPFDERLLKNLTHLKETVFAKSMVPAVSVQPIECDIGRAGRSSDEADIVMREYKMAIERQTELARECNELRHQLEASGAELARGQAQVGELQEEVRRLESQADYSRGRLEDERQKMELRETRLLQAHEAQAEVARRAAEHSNRCLQEMLQKREATIKELESHLQTERRRSAEHQLSETMRMEKLHEHMFRENSAMVERFKEAIHGVGENLARSSAEAYASSLPAADGLDQTGAQLRLLTAETIRLRGELKQSRATITALEFQLGAQLERAQSALAVDATRPATAAELAAPSHSDALLGVIHSQSAMLASLRQRESSLTEDLATEQHLRTQAERELEVCRLRAVEQGGALQLMSQVAGASDPAVVSELRAQLAAVEQTLRDTRAKLDEERAASRELHVSAEEWKARLSALHTEVAAQQSEVERSRNLVALNEELQREFHAVREKNDKLTLAATVLKQKLLEEAHRHGEADRKQQQSIAVAQRMGAIQQESAEQMKVLDGRLKSIQKELTERVAREQEMVGKHMEAQRLLYELHQQLRAKDQEVGALHARLSSGDSRPAGGTCGAAAERSAPPSAPSDAEPAAPSTARPHPTHPEASRPASPVEARGVAAAARRAGRRSRDVREPPREAHPDTISSLRGSAHRLAEALEEARAQCTAERETVRQLRSRVAELQAEAAQAEEAHARELVRLHRLKMDAEAARGTPTPDVPARRPTVYRLAQELAAARGVALETILETYEVPAGPHTGGAVVQAHHNQVELLETTVENLRMALQRLQTENAALTREASDAARSAAPPAEVAELRRREQHLRAQVTALSARLAAAREPGRALDSMENQHHHHLHYHHHHDEDTNNNNDTHDNDDGPRRRLSADVVRAPPRETLHRLDSTANRAPEDAGREARPVDHRGVRPLTAAGTPPRRPADPSAWRWATVPPPLPQAPFARRRPVSSAEGGRGEASGVPVGPQRRLSFTSGDHSPHPSDLHAHLPHHHMPPR